MINILIFVIGALFGMVLTLSVLLFGREKEKQPEGETSAAPPDEKQTRLQEQWENFFSYNGTDQNGGI